MPFALAGRGFPALLLETGKDAEEIGGDKGSDAQVKRESVRIDTQRARMWEKQASRVTCTKQEVEPEL